MSHLGVLLCALLLAPPATELLTLEIRVFAGSEDVTGETRVTVHRAGERGQPVGKVAAIEPRVLVQVPPGIYDVQAVRERDGRVLNIRWAQRLVVMPYPDEAGHHLEVINFTAGFGALQIRSSNNRPDAAPRVALLSAGSPDTTIAAAPGNGYILYVVPAGLYDIEVTRNNRPIRHKAIEVPLDRTRLWIVP